MPAVLGQIDTVVMLMLENRSLDTVLGWLYHDSPPNMVYPPGSALSFDGIPAGASNRDHSKVVRPAVGTAALKQPCRVPRWDPHEPFEHVEIQLFADGDGRLPPDPWSSRASMAGFAYDYEAFYDADAEVMGAYAEEQLPVLYGLAKSFAVSDRWFASVPTQTNANRAFSLCGTSLGGVDNGSPELFDTPTIFDALTGRKSWGVYWQYDGLGSGDPHFGTPCYTSQLFPSVARAAAAGNGTVAPYASFLNALASGDELPAFCYLEPFWGGGKGYPTGHDFVGLQGNDYHPPAWVGPAEHSLNVLYDALRTSRQWERMLFIVTFDEHGGSWDHVPPTVCVAPDGHREHFDFATLGVRVPTMLVTPFVTPGTVFRAPAGSAYDFDHTSFIATLLKWAAIDPKDAGLGDRVAVAPTFEDVLGTTPTSQTPPFVVPAGYESQGGGLGPHLLDHTLVGVPIQAVRAAIEHNDTADTVTAALAGLAAVAQADRTEDALDERKACR